MTHEAAQTYMLNLTYVCILRPMVSISVLSARGIGMPLNETVT